MSCGLASIAVVTDPAILRAMGMVQAEPDHVEEGVEFFGGEPSAEVVERVLECFGGRVSRVSEHEAAEVAAADPAFEPAGLDHEA